jgi:beta-glucuronidase
VTLRLADELGLLVWAEVPVYWEHIDYGSAHTLALATSMLTDMIRRDRNRASIILWSIANETPVEGARTRFLQALIAEARRQDPTRLITAALNKNVDVGGAAEGQSHFVVEDPLGADLDVIAVNQYEAWYSARRPDQLDQVRFSSKFAKPLIFSEFGADARHGTRGPKEHLWTEDYQAWLYEETLKLVDRTPGCAGISPWLLKDFRSPRRWHGKHQDFWNRKGLIAETGERKLAWAVLHSYYQRRMGMDT